MKREEEVRAKRELGLGMPTLPRRALDMWFVVRQIPAETSRDDADSFPKLFDDEL